jgi:hypothetical protein
MPPYRRTAAPATPTPASSDAAQATASSRITRATFVQLELAGTIGLPEGRYLVREADSERVLIVQDLMASRPRRRGRRRAKPVDPASPGEVPVTRVTVTGERLPDSAAGDAWLDAIFADSERLAAEVRAATAVINRAIGAHRAAAADPLVQEIGASKALAIRVGHGDGEQLAEGTWSEARELPERRSGRLDDVDSQSRVAAVLAGREEIHPAETLILRARLDAEQGRHAEALYGVRAARAALDERPAERSERIREHLAAVEARLAGGD